MTAAASPRQVQAPANDPNAVIRGAVLLVALVLIGAFILAKSDTAAKVTSAPKIQTTKTTVAKDTTANQSQPSATGQTVTTVALRAPAEIKVVAANGVGTKGIGTRATKVLQTAAYNALSPVDAKQTETSAVFYAVGYEREAAALATTLGFLPESVQPMPAETPLKKATDLRDANILVLVGNDGVAKLPAE